MTFSINSFFFTFQQISYNIISENVRCIIIAQYYDGITIKEIAMTVGLPESTCYSIVKKFKDTANVSASPRGGITYRKMTPPIFQYIDDMLSEDASYTLAFISEKIFEKFNIR
ncbi:hypothetical protein M153_5674000962, partial [Pseudoloma neurophilia]